MRENRVWAVVGTVIMCGDFKRRANPAARDWDGMPCLYCSRWWRAFSLEKIENTTCTSLTQASHKHSTYTGKSLRDSLKVQFQRHWLNATVCSVGKKALSEKNKNNYILSMASFFPSSLNSDHLHTLPLTYPIQNISAAQADRRGLQVNVTSERSSSAKASISLNFWQ